jgi:membrane protein
LLADPSTIRSHLETLSGLLPGGALSVIGDQITRVSAQGKTTLGFTFLAAFGVSLWSANAGTKALFDALNIVSLGFTLIGIVLLLIALAAMVVLPTVLAYLGIASKTEWLLKVARWPLLVLLVSIRGLNYLPSWGRAGSAHNGDGSPGEAPSRLSPGFLCRSCFLSMLKILAISMKPTARSVQSWVS